MIRTPLDAPNTRHRSATVRCGLVATLFVLAAASCSTLPRNEIAADGAAMSTTTYVTTPPTSAPRTSAPSTTAGESAETTVPSTTVVPTTGAPATEPPTTAAPATEPPTTEPPTTAAPTTAAPTTAAPTTAAPTTAPPTTTAPTTAAPTTASPPTTTAAQGEDLEELPYTGPSEAVLFALIGLTMIVAGRSVLDLTGMLSRFHRVGDDLPPR